MKILFNTYYHAFQNPGGGEIVLHKTREALIKKGIQVDLFDLWNSKISDYDILHDFSSLNWRCWEGYKAYGPKLVVTPVTWPDVSIKSCIKERLKSLFKNSIGMSSPEVNMWNAMRLPDCFFPTTSMEEERIIKRFDLVDTKKFKVVYNGVDLAGQDENINLFKNKFHEENYFLYVGRISPLKNVEKIIQAALSCNEKLLLIGSADQIDSKYYNYLISKYSNPKITFIGSITDRNLLYSAYLNAKAVIVASKFETCSLVGLEAGIRGIPVIMTQNGATKEVYQDFVEYVDPDDLNSIIEKLKVNWSSEKRQLLQKHIETHFSWDKVAAELIKNYSDILK